MGASAPLEEGAVKAAAPWAARFDRGTLKQNMAALLTDLVQSARWEVAILIQKQAELNAFVGKKMLIQ